MLLDVVRNGFAGLLWSTIIWSVIFLWQERRDKKRGTPVIINKGNRIMKISITGIFLGMLSFLGNQ